MFKPPPLKRTYQPDTLANNSSRKPPFFNPLLEAPSNRLDSANLLIPSQMLVAPTDKHKSKGHFIAPLLCKSYKYPSKIDKKMRGA